MAGGSDSARLIGNDAAAVPLMVAVARVKTFWSRSLRPFGPPLIPTT
ncbi:MAG: hypothetical protein WKF75_00620 [Singulisphaera sp.]